MREFPSDVEDSINKGILLVSAHFPSEPRNRELGLQRKLSWRLRKEEHPQLWIEVLHQEEEQRVQDR
jgi:hypothetical protein